LQSGKQRGRMLWPRTKPEGIRVIGHWSIRFFRK